MFEVVYIGISYGLENAKWQVGFEIVPPASISFVRGCWADCIPLMKFSRRPFGGCTVSRGVAKMSPARTDGNQIEMRLATEVKTAEDSYRLIVEQHLKAVQGFRNYGDITAQNTLYAMAKEARIARKRYRRAAMTLAGFAGSR